MRIVLLGDSHLARVRRDLPMVGSHVRNSAVGGATSRDLLSQASRAGVEEHDVVVVSVGTNDAAPHHDVPVPEFADAMARCLRSVPARGWVYVAPPGVDDSRASAAGGRTNALVDAYREAAVAVCDEVGARVVRTEEVVRPLGSDAFVSDGMHLSGRAYRLVLPAIAEAVRATA